MITVISPSKRLNYDPTEVRPVDTPFFGNNAMQLISVLRKKSRPEIASLMNISEDLADLNYKRYKSFRRTYTEDNSKPALLAFTGDVYLGLEANDFLKDDIDFAQKHLRILSGLYGLLRPMDAMQAYRLEMGSPLENKKGKNLHEFWGDSITKELNKLLKDQKQLLQVLFHR